MPEEVTYNDINLTVNTRMIYLYVNKSGDISKTVEYVNDGPQGIREVKNGRIRII